jgi:superfamily I DNA and/or RNA helicase
VPNNLDFYWYSRNKLFLLFLATKRNFISVTLSQRAFQPLRGGKKCLRYFYPDDQQLWAKTADLMALLANTHDWQKLHKEFTWEIYTIEERDLYW